eukprot:scaffold6276_cov138-Cylindrotheca_fusiformis.AAC.7
MNAEATTVPFHPTKVDVVCTKLRTWNTKHPGNIYFNKLIQEKVPSIQNDAQFRPMANELIEYVISEKGARFLKLSDKECFANNLTPKVCTVMNRKQCLHKVIRSMRTAYARHHGNLPARTKSPSKLKRKMYEAKPGNRPIQEHALQLISLVCNTRRSEPYRVLDKPIPISNGNKNDDEDNENNNSSTEVPVQIMETEKHRLMRLQMRHRYASAHASKMSSIEFSKKLLELWGGSLVRVKLPKDDVKQQSPATNSDSPPTATKGRPKKPKQPRVQSQSPQTQQVTINVPAINSIVQDVEAPRGSPFAKSQESRLPKPLLSNTTLVKSSPIVARRLVMQQQHHHPNTTTATTTTPSGVASLYPTTLFSNNNTTATAISPITTNNNNNNNGSPRDGLILELSTSVAPSET